MDQSKPRFVVTVNCVDTSYPLEARAEFWTESEARAFGEWYVPRAEAEAFLAFTFEIRDRYAAEADALGLPRLGAGSAS